MNGDLITAWDAFRYLIFEVKMDSSVAEEIFMSIEMGPTVDGKVTVYKKDIDIEVDKYFRSLTEKNKK